jgi:hypothetical protein
MQNYNPSPLECIRVYSEERPTLLGVSMVGCRGAEEEERRSCCLSLHVLPLEGIQGNAIVIGDIVMRRKCKAQLTRCKMWIYLEKKRLSLSESV